MRVVHVFKDYFPPTTGGIEQHVRLLCEGLAARGTNVAVLVPSRSRRRVDERLDGVRVVRIPEFGRYAAVPLCPTMPRELARLQPDLVHLHFPNPMGDLAYPRQPRARQLVISYHADVIRQRRLLPLYRPMLRSVFGRARRVIVGSREYLASSAVLAGYESRCAVVPYGIDPAAFALRDEDAAAVLRHRAAGAGQVLFVGVLRPYKGLDVLLEAMTQVQARLTVVGRGPASGDLAQLAARLGIAERVTFRGRSHGR